MQLFDIKEIKYKLKSNLQVLSMVVITQRELRLNWITL